MCAVPAIIRCTIALERLKLVLTGQEAIVLDVETQPIVCEHLKHMSGGRSFPPRWVETEPIGRERLKEHAVPIHGRILFG